MPAKAAEFISAQKIIAGTNCGMVPMRREIAALKLEAHGRRRTGAQEIGLVFVNSSKARTDHLIAQKGRE